MLVQTKLPTIQVGKYEKLWKVIFFTVKPLIVTFFN